MTRKRKTYKPESLLKKNDSIIEDLRIRMIFVELKKLALSGQYLSQSEVKFLCIQLKFSKLKDGNINSFEACQDYTFIKLYSTYFQNISISNEARNEYNEEIPLQQRVIDINTLEEFADKWLTNVINIDKHKNFVIQYIAKEGRKKIKELKKQPQFNDLGFFRVTNLFRKKERAIALQTKFIYLIVLEVFENAEEYEFQLSLNGNKLEYNEYSLIHILNRHYAQSVSQFPTNQSFHIEDVQPRKIHILLKDIFKKIDNAGIILNGIPENIPIRYNNNIYNLWTEKRTKQKSNIGNILFHRIETFYLVNSQKELNEIQSFFVETNIDSNLSIFIKLT